MSVTMGAWGAEPFNVEGYTHPHSEWMAVTEGSVTVAAGGKEKLFTKGDIFKLKQGLRDIPDHRASRSTLNQ